MLKHVLSYSLGLLMVMVVGGSLWSIGLILFTRIIPLSGESKICVTDGIVIFTGGDSRLKAALTLFEQKKGNYLLISGVNPHSTLPQIVAHMPFRSRITLGYNALDTLGNAEETAQWVRDHQIKTLRLITSNYHMPRSLLELRPLLPNVQILPHPVVKETFLKPKWWLEYPTFFLVIQEYNKFLFALIRRSFEDLKGLLRVKERIPCYS